ncbi:MAG: flagellar basal body-associated FliL family protein [Nitrosomonadales bacterium]|nr:flagellar basal body-associated FliL family protein [Nitrosomonadales bacterium]
MSKPAKPGPSDASGTPPGKSNSKPIIITAFVSLLIGGGAAAFLLMKPSHPAKPDETAVAAEEVHHETPSTYVQLGTFTANLIHEEGDRYLQVAIELKITKPELAEKIKAANPEILHHINMLLQSKRPSELASFDGKQKLAEQIKAQVEFVLGLRKTPPAITDPEATPDKVEHVAQAAPAEAQSSPAGMHTGKSDAGKSGIVDVLFTSFIIQ